MNYQRLLNAVSYACRVHHGQTRADGNTPYVSHPFRVLTIMSLIFGIKDETLLITAVLHDTIEDTDANYDSIANLFGTDVADNVAKLTKDMRLPKVNREQQFLDEFDNLPDGVKLCKLGDMLDNLIDTGMIDDNKLKSITGKAQAILQSFQPIKEEVPLMQAAIQKVEDQLEEQIKQIE